MLRILTWKEADFSGSFSVRYDGKITIPFVGDIDVAGRTPTELKGELEESIGKFVDVARVSVAIEEPNSARFFVLGKVAQQGALPYSGPLRIAQALALAGGFQEFAKLDQIFVIREVNGELIYFPFNYDDFVNRRQLTGNLILFPATPSSSPDEIDEMANRVVSPSMARYLALLAWLGAPASAFAQRPPTEWTFSIGARQANEFSRTDDGIPQEERIMDAVNASLGLSTSNDAGSIRSLRAGGSERPSLR